MAPKLSVLQKAFARKDVTVVAIYIETCDGVPDHAAELRRVVARHRIDYPVLDGEAGSINDPTRKRFPWAPHALIVDREGVVLRTYGHMPHLRVLRSDLGTLVRTGRFPERPDDGWRDFRRGAWAEFAIERDGYTVRERTTLRLVAPDGVTLRRGEGKKEEKLMRETFGPAAEDYCREEQTPQALRIDGREVRAKVFRATWNQDGDSFEVRSWIADGVLVRRETTKTVRFGAPITRVYRLLKWRSEYALGARRVDCRVAQTVTSSKGLRTVEEAWTSPSVPGHLVHRIRKTVRKGVETAETTALVGYGLQ